MSNQLICFIEKDCRVIGPRDMEGEEEKERKMWRRRKGWEGTFAHWYFD